MYGVWEKRNWSSDFLLPSTRKLFPLSVQIEGNTNYRSWIELIFIHFLLITHYYNETYTTDPKQIFKEGKQPNSKTSYDGRLTKIRRVRIKFDTNVYWRIYWNSCNEWKKNEAPSNVHTFQSTFLFTVCGYRIACRNLYLCMCYGDALVKEEYYNEEILF